MDEQLDPEIASLLASSDGTPAYEEFSLDNIEEIDIASKKTYQIFKLQLPNLHSKN